MRNRRFHHDGLNDDERPGRGGRRHGFGREHHFPAEGGGPPHYGGGEGGRHGRGPGGDGMRGRARRGEAKYVLLDALRDGPKHGYEIIRVLEERSGGQYAPSAGTVYPTMQYLEDLGLVHADQDAGRRVYQLTPTGRAELEARTEEIEAFWSRFAATAASPALRHEIGFLREELDDLARTVWSGLRRRAIDRDFSEPARAVRQALERCKNEIRDIIARDAAPAEAV